MSKNTKKDSSNLTNEDKRIIADYTIPTASICDFSTNSKMYDPNNSAVDIKPEPRIVLSKDYLPGDNSHKEEEKFTNLLKYKKHDKCCIVGFAPSWNEAPFSEKDIDFWGLNELYGYTRTIVPEPEFTLWFETHEIKNSPTKQKKFHQEFLKSTKIPIVTLKHWDEYPTSVPYPLNYIISSVDNCFIKEEGTKSFDDYSNSISWMIALAIQMEYKEIFVYGVDMAQETEYFFQKSSCNFFLGLAAGRGIKLKLPASCHLCSGNGKLYGFESENSPRFRTKKKIDSLQQSVVRLHQRNAELEFYKEDVDKSLKENTFKADLDIKIIEQEIQALRLRIAVARNLKECLETIPQDINAINKIRPGKINSYQITIDNCNSKIKRLQEEVQGIKDKQFRRQRDNFVANKMYSDETEINKENINRLRGHIDENNHLLNNNLV